VTTPPTATPDTPHLCPACRTSHYRPPRDVTDPQGAHDAIAFMVGAFGFVAAQFVTLYLGPQ
jgi:hypothetical protein